MAQQNRKFFVTINTQIDDVAALYNVNEMDYFACCMEAAPTTGHVHYHILVIYKKRRRLSAVSHDFPTANVQVAKGTIHQIMNYLTKEDNLIFEAGEQPVDLRRPCPTSSDTRFKEMVARTKEGALDRECILYARYRSYFDSLDVQYSYKFTWPGELPAKNIWIWGPTGSGKSRMVHEYIQGFNKSCYLKLLNKWWDGFFKQDFVLIEDADPTKCKCLAHHFKLWADRYTFSGEVKGGIIVIYPNYHFVVTSNYSIEECFDAEDASAIRRRFDVLYWN